MAEERFYPNKIARAMLMALEEIMGKNGVNAVLNMAGLKHLVNNYPPNNLEKQFRFEDLSGVNQALEEMYGIRGGRGLSLRCGRAGFKYGLKEFGAVLGIADLAFRLMPLNMKIKVGLTAMAETFTRFSDQPSFLREEPDQFIYVIEYCPVCWGRKSEAPCCHMAAGLILEGLAWGSGGKNFRVEEVECVATGGEVCAFAIDKKPLE